MKKSKILVLVLLSGLLCAFGQPAWIAWLAPVVAVGGYAVFWIAAGNIASNKTRFWVATAWFMFVQLIQLSWMTSIEYQGFYILFVYAFLALGLGVQFGMITSLMSQIPLIATAALWTLMEWMRLFFLCGFSWNPLGLTLTAIPLSLQAASLFGVLGLSFWVILTNLACWKRRWKTALCLALCPYLFGAVQWNLHRTKILSAPHMSVALVQTALLPSQKTYLPEKSADFLSPYEQWTRIFSILSKVKAPVDLVVLPESAVPFTDQYPFYFKERISQILGGNDKTTDSQKVSNQYWVNALAKWMGSDVIIGMDTEERGRYFSSALFYSWKDEKIQKYDKQILLPLAEYLPFTHLKALTQLYGISDFFEAGKKSTLFHSKVPISASICYEETFGSVMRQGRKEGAALFVNVTNDNWYPNSRLPKQHFDLAKVHAVANGTPIIRSCNAGMTSAVDSLGCLIAQIDDWNRPDVLVAHVPLYQFDTLYTFWGDLGIVVASIVLLLFCCVMNRKSLFWKSPIR